MAINDPDNKEIIDVNQVINSITPERQLDIQAALVNTIREASVRINDDGAAQVVKDAVNASATPNFSDEERAAAAPVALSLTSTDTLQDPPVLLATIPFTMSNGIVDLGTEDIKDKAPAVPEIKAAPLEPTPANSAPQVITGAAPVVEEKKTETVTDFASLISKLSADSTPNQKSLLRSLAIYMEKLAPGKFVEGDDGARAQYTFWRAIRFIIEDAPQEEFRRLYSILLAYFQHHKDAIFHERYIFRFSEFWHQDPQELAMFQAILNIIKLTCNPDERAKGLKQVSLARSLDTGYSEQGRQRIMTFYGN